MSDGHEKKWGRPRPNLDAILTKANAEFRLGIPNGASLDGNPFDNNNAEDAPMCLIHGNANANVNVNSNANVNVNVDNVCPRSELLMGLTIVDSTIEFQPETLSYLTPIVIFDKERYPIEDRDCTPFQAQQFRLTFKLEDLPFGLLSAKDTIKEVCYTLFHRPIHEGPIYLAHDGINFTNVSIYSPMVFHYKNVTSLHFTTKT